MVNVEKVKINTQLNITNLVECKIQQNKIQEITTNDNWKMSGKSWLLKEKHYKNITVERW